MWPDEVIAMAREAGIASWHLDLRVYEQCLERFAKLIAAKEREACAQVCEDVSLQAATLWKLAYQPQDQGREMGADDCAAAIRARDKAMKGEPHGQNAP